jgi:hypothetical protein
MTLARSHGISWFQNRAIVRRLDSRSRSDGGAFREQSARQAPPP